MFDPVVVEVSAIDISDVFSPPALFKVKLKVKMNEVRKTDVRTSRPLVAGSASFTALLHLLVQKWVKVHPLQSSTLGV